ncbi:sugar phosphorylase [Paenibacillus sp. R14(2021)]|uniref:sugar phosphorylase n=1 Tax=Paenibacillus sp. R14(2021) TaxID=2859228 RepID=UPI0021585F67|nr:sugar phosphorylase [Paenibacillus sp. R14(2021)]
MMNTMPMIPQAAKGSLLDKLHVLYGTQSAATLAEIESLLHEFGRLPAKPWVSENDVLLITYGDSIKEDGLAPLATLKEFLRQYAKDTITGVHILPFYPYTSDDGFSVVDYAKVNPELGDWEDVQRLSEDFDLMFDGVINHISKSSEWFQGYLNGDARYADYFTEADPSLDYSKVTRPRNLPLLTRFTTKNGEKYIWTTFSEDQIDINFQNPKVLLDILKVLLLYVNNGARFIRLDAIGFSWKRLGTTCMHLDELHTLVKLIREVLDITAPGTILITETNVPHKDNISYFGNGFDEAQMVYQFPLPPLTLFSFHTKSAVKLMQWAEQLEPTSAGTTFFNFLSSHDGIGMRPVEDRLTSAEKQLMVDKAVEHGGRVSYKDNGDGTTSAYELNVNYLDALSHPNDPDDVRIKKFLAAHAILLSMAGVPGIYIHSLFGSRNDYAGLEQSGINRRINREKLSKADVCEELESESLRSAVFARFSALIQLRRRQNAFSPQAAQKVVTFDERIFSVVRENAESGDSILALVNVSDENVQLRIDYAGQELITGKAVGQSIELLPYQFMWIKR